MEKYCEKSDKTFIGVKGCDLRALKIKGMIFTPSRLDSSIQTLLDTDLKEALRTLIYGNIDSGLEGCPVLYEATMTPTDNSEGVVLASYGAGYNEYIRGGNAILQFDFPQKWCKAQKIMGLNRWNGGIVFITKDDRLVFGSYSGGEYHPFELLYNYSSPKIFDDEQNATLNSMVIALGDVDIIFPKIAITDKVEDIATIDLEGVIDGTIEVITAAAASVVFKAVDSCTGADITSLTYKVTGTPNVPTLSVKITTPAGVSSIATATLTDGQATLSGTFATGTKIEVLPGIKDTAVATDDICYYYAAATLTIT